MKKILLILLLLASVSSAIDKCGVPAYFLRRERPLTPGRTPQDNHYDSEGGNFRLWFTLEGTNAIPSEDADNSGHPDWVELAAGYLERTRAYLVDTLGMRPPLPDSTSVGGGFDVGGDDRTDIYFENLNEYGMSYTEYLVGDTSYTSYIKIENDFDATRFPQYVGREEEALAVTCAHEFFHVIHYTYGYNYFWVWWMEATAVWSEERNFPEINDYLGYLSKFQSYPQHGLNVDNPNDRIYGTSLFAIYLTENYGDRVIRDIWEKIPTLAVFGAIEQWADSVGVDPDELYGDFARWNLFVGENYRGFGYPDAPLMPEPTITIPDSIPDTLTGCGSAVYIDISADTESGVWAMLQSSDTLSAMMHGVPIDGTDAEDTSVNIYSHSDTIPGAWRFDIIAATFAHFDPIAIWAPAEAYLDSFSYGIAQSAFVAYPADEMDLPPYPNPFIYEESETLYFPYTSESESPIRLSVWTASGNLVYENTDETNRGSHRLPANSFPWIPENMHGEKLSTGIYLYLLAVESERYTGKFAIIKN